MPAPFEFQLQLTGGFAGALAPVNQGLATTEKNLVAAAAGAKEFEGALEGVVSQKAPVWTFDLAQGLRLVVDGAAAAARAIARVGEMAIGTAAQTEDLELALNLNVGEKQAAAIRGLAESFGRTTRFGAAAIERAVLPFIDAGVTQTKVLDDVLTAAADIAARRGGGLAAFENAAAAFGKVAATKKVDDDVLRALSIPMGDYFKALGGAVGMTAEDAQKAMTKGLIPTETLLQTALLQFQARQGGAIGGAALAAGRTLGASIDRLMRLPEDLFRALSGSVGMKQVQGAIDMLVNTLSGPSGQAVVANIGSIVGGIAGMVTSAGGVQILGFALKGIGALTGGVVAAIGIVGGVLGFIVQGAVELGTALSPVIQLVGKGLVAAFKIAVGFIQGVWPIVLEAAEAARPIFEELGIVFDEAAAALAPLAPVGQAVIGGVVLPLLRILAVEGKMLVIPVIRGIGDVFKNYVAPAAQFVADVVTAIAGAIGRVLEYIRQLRVFVADYVGNGKFSEIFALAGEGWRQGLLGKKAEVAGAASQVAGATDTAMRNELEVHSPSRKAMRTAASVVDGFLIPLEGARDQVAAAIGNSFGGDIAFPFEGAVDRVAASLRKGLEGPLDLSLGTGGGGAPGAGGGGPLIGEVNFVLADVGQRDTQALMAEIEGNLEPLLMRLAMRSRLQMAGGPL